MYFSLVFTYPLPLRHVPGKSQLGDRLRLRTVIASFKLGPVTPNEIVRIAQHVRKEMKKGSWEI